METKTYIVRALKYLVWLVLLFMLVFTLMALTGTSRAGAGDLFAELFGTSRGAVMIAVIVVLALLYPRFGFTRRTLRASLAADRDLIVGVFAGNGFAPVAESGSEIRFRAASPPKRALLLWEDTITVTAAGDTIVIDGIRKEAVKAEFRLRSQLGQ